MTYFPEIEFYKDCAGRGSIITVKKSIDFDYTPSQLYSVLYEADSESFLLESARVHEVVGRYSFVGVNPFLVFKGYSEHAEQKINGVWKSQNTDALAELKKIMNIYNRAYIKVKGMPNFTAGAVGYFSYDLGTRFENIPEKTENDMPVPDIYFMFCDTIVCFDHKADDVFILTSVFVDENLEQSYDLAIKKINFLHERIDIKKPEISPEPFILQELARRKEDADTVNRLGFESNLTQEEFERIVARAKEYIKGGDIFQANLSQRFSKPFFKDPFHLYQTLKAVNPSPFACFLKLEDLTVAGSSPERLLELKEGIVQTRPIAGTRPRGYDTAHDESLAEELILNEKERAEHIMLVDLERNDVGRVCQYGSVSVNELMVLEKYSHVIHIVSNIRGVLEPGMDMFDCIKACFPGGTITGTPKVRCMQIIEELEPVKRKIYTGSIGYLSFSGGMDLNIAIRTFVLYNSMLYAQVGAGIVSDSIPHNEYRETLYKAAALLKAYELLETRIQGHSNEKPGSWI